MADRFRTGLPMSPLWISARRFADEPARGRFGRRVAGVALAALVLVQAVSLFGYAYFVRHPQNLAEQPWALPIFSNFSPLVAQVGVATAFVAMVLGLSTRVGIRWLPAFLVGFGVSLGSELAGAAYGFPFGTYAYNEIFGVKALGRVPWLVPLSWFLMALASYGIVFRWVSHRRVSFRRILLGAWLLLTWNLTLDPAMNHLAPFSVWSDAVTYFGMPVLSIGGWFVTGTAILFTFEVLRCPNWVANVPFLFFLGFYLLNLALPAGIVLIAGVWQPWAVMLASFTLLAAALLLLRQGPEDGGAAFLSAARTGRFS